MFSDWVNKASQKYETYSLINDLFEKFQIYKKPKKQLISELDDNLTIVDEKNESVLINENSNSDKTNFHGKNKSGIKSKEIFQDDEMEGDFCLKKEIIDLIEIDSHQNYENKYIIDLSKYNNKIKKSYPEFISYSLLDIDPKINIKSYQNFNYVKLYNRYLTEVNKNYFIQYI